MLSRPTSPSPAGHIIIDDTETPMYFNELKTLSDRFDEHEQTVRKKDLSAASEPMFAKPISATIKKDMSRKILKVPCQATNKTNNEVMPSLMIQNLIEKCQRITGALDQMNLSRSNLQKQINSSLNTSQYNPPDPQYQTNREKVSVLNRTIEKMQDFYQSVLS